jgi:spore coat protein U-like protein
LQVSVSLPHTPGALPAPIANFLWSGNLLWWRIQRVKIPLVAAAVVAVAAASTAASAAPSCKSITVTALAFGNYDVYAAGPIDSAGTIGYSCPPPTIPMVDIDAGLAFAGGRRRMTRTAGTADWLSYDIFEDAARSVVWTTGVTVPAGNAVTVPYYARIFPLQDVSVGGYSDTLIVTFNF